jgi:hypothetical protein
MRRSILLAVMAAGVTVIILGAAGSFAGSESSGPPPLQCDNGDQVLSMESTHSTDAKGASAEDAVTKEVTPTYPGLKASMLTRTDEKSDAVQLTYTRGGRRLAVLSAQKIGSGWGVESMVACNRFLIEMKGQGR